MGVIHFPDYIRGKWQGDGGTITIGATTLTDNGVIWIPNAVHKSGSLIENQWDLGNQDGGTATIKYTMTDNAYKNDYTQHKKIDFAISTGQYTAKNRSYTQYTPACATPFTAFPQKMIGTWEAPSGLTLTVTSSELRSGANVYVPKCVDDDDVYTITLKYVEGEPPATPTDVKLRYRGGSTPTLELNDRTYARAAVDPSSKRGFPTWISLFVLVFFLWWIMQDM